MRAFTAAAVQVAPLARPLTPETVKANLDRCVELVEECVQATGAELVVLPETASTGFVPGCSVEELWQLVSTIPGPVTEPAQEVAARLGVHLVLGSYERGEAPDVLYNTATVIGPSGDVLGSYRKTHPYHTELRVKGGWVTPGEHPLVVDTELGRIGLIICFDGDFPELSRITAIRGAEIICRPSALLRPADIWELTNRARAYDNHVFVIGSNATGTDPGGTHYFGNSMIVTPTAEVVARAATHECWITARLDPDRAMRALSPGSSVPQGFDHLADRNLELIKRYADDLAGPAATGFPRAESSRSMTVRIGIDTGGTFTDVVALDEDTGGLVSTKTPSTPADPAEGFLAGIRKVLDLLGLDGSAVHEVSHGTTVATNRLLEGKITGLGFVTTEGYRHILEIARQSVPDGYGNSYFWVKPARIVPVDRVRTVGGRLDVTGRELRPFHEPDAVAAARFFRDHGITTVGVCLLHSYANPEHELRMRDVLAAEHPDAVVSISSEVLREYREYERSVTTLVDAAVKPDIVRYLRSVAKRLRGLRPGGVPLRVMKSNGGVASAAEVVRQPITTVLSGPAAGALGAATVAARAGYPSVLTLDGGGTSTDVAVVLNGHPALTTEGSVGAYPSKIPMIDVVTVGAGGGSIARVSPEGTLKVGPQSAGADPGPLCYRRGGTDPTVTDAHLVLGRIPPHLLGGEIPLDTDVAADGLTQLGGKLGLDLERCAAGVLEVSAWNQANALRRVTVQRGLDVRDFTMVTFGGSGSLLACRLIDVLGLTGVLVPPNPGNLSAFGLLTVDVRIDYVRTAVQRHAALELRQICRIFEELTAEAEGALQREGFAAGERRFERTADLRYVGQAFEVRVPVPAGEFDGELAAVVADSFHVAHNALYGYDFRGDDRQQVEWVNLRVTGVGPIRQPEIPAVDRDEGPSEPVRSDVRPVYFDTWVDTPVYQRAKLGPGDVVAGPAIIQEFGSTVPVHPGFAARVDQIGNLLLGAGGAS